MKYLNDYTEDKQTELLNRLGAFFAFNQKQFRAQRKDGEKYTSLGSGTIVPARNAKALIDGMGKIVAEGIKEDKRDHTPEQIIQRELANHECFYTGDIAPCIDALDGYGFSKNEVRAVFNKEYAHAVEN